MKGTTKSAQRYSLGQKKLFTWDSYRWIECVRILKKEEKKNEREKRENEIVCKRMYENEEA